MTLPKLARTVALMTALTGLSATALSVSTAQDKGTANKTDKKSDKKATGTIDISEDKNGKFRFMVHDADGDSVAMSTHAYKTRDEAVKAVNEMKEIVAGVTKIGTAKKKMDDHDAPMKKGKDK